MNEGPATNNHEVTEDNDLDSHQYQATREDDGTATAIVSGLKKIVKMLNKGKSRKKIKRSLKNYIALAEAIAVESQNV